MKSQKQWFFEYAESHQHPTNKRIHCIAVPAIYWSIIALLWSVPIFSINVALLALVPVMCFYWQLSPTVFNRMLIFSVLCCVIAAVIEQLGSGLWRWAAGVFVVAWVFQFIGHRIEGKRPSFFADLAFLLIGPAWIMASLSKKH